MAQSIRERIPELAILKTLGFSDGKVTALVLAEALLLLVLAGAASAWLVAAGLLPALNRATGGRFPPLFVTAETWLLAAAHRRGAGRARDRASAGAPRAPPPDRGRPRRAPLRLAVRALHQVVEITLMNLRTLPQRLGTSLVVVVGIAGVVGVLVSVLAMSEGFRHTLASTGRPDRVILLRAGSDAELSSGVPRDQATLLTHAPRRRPRRRGPPARVGRARGDGRPAPQGRDRSQQRAVPRRRSPPPSPSGTRLRIVEGRRFQRGVREVIVGRKAAQQFAGLGVGSRIAFRDSDWTVVGIFATGGDVHESEIWADAEVTMSAFRRTGYQSLTARLADGSAAGLAGASRTRSAATRASRSACCGSPSTTRSRRRCSRA